MADTAAEPLPEDWMERDSAGSYYVACAAQAEMYASGITGMDVPHDPWTKDDVAYWTGTARYQPWKDVAAMFRPNPRVAE